MSPDGKFSKFMDKGFTAPKGMIYRDGMLFVADQKQIHIIDVNEASIIESIPIEGAVSLNDIAIGEGGQIYVTDMGW
jgi:sugar lactone lactonase YvrE